MHTNALIHEKSPYLRQHAHNPVDWMPWGEAAFTKARAEDKPIFLSIGYSTCHWCHVMAHESFENEQVAQVLNREFVPVKLDREERPDVDRVYMLFVQASTGSGGWPMSVWLTPELKPFFGGTYFPPDSRYGRPGFADLLEQLAHAWKRQRTDVEASGRNVAEQLRALSASAKTSGEPDRELFAAPYWQFRRMYDSRWGGFGSAPKFPRPVVLNYLLRYYAAEESEEAQRARLPSAEQEGDSLSLGAERSKPSPFSASSSEALEMVTHTLRAMAAGGMHDQLGGGFHRYSVDERWFVPHFEKMLYDQAQLAISYLEAYQITKDEQFAQVARGIFEYVLRDLSDPAGGFYSAEDADSPDPENPSHSGEGAFYIWKQAEIEALLGREDSEVFCSYFGVLPAGNVDEDPHGEFIGRNILYQAQRAASAGESLSEPILRARQVLLEARGKRPRPHLDRKVLSSWNGLMISAFAKASAILGETRYLEAAQRAMSFLLSTMYDASSGHLQRRFCEGEAAIPAFLDDYAFVAQALLDLFEASSDPACLRTAIDLAKRGFKQFEDTTDGGFFSTTDSAPDLLLRMKDDYDGAEPSGNSVATDVLLRLAHLTGEDDFRVSAQRSLSSFAPKMKAQPTIAPQMSVALGRWLAEPEQVVLRYGEANDNLAGVLAREREKFAPAATVLALSDEAAEKLRAIAPFLGGLDRKGNITAYRCRNFTCELPRNLD
jgi:hypothetical protein